MNENRVHDLTIVISHLGAGGAQRVATNLANGWAAQKFKICVITILNKQHDHFSLDASISRLILQGSANRLPWILRPISIVSRILALRRAIGQSKAPTVLAFIGSTNIIVVLAAIGLGKKIIISERNDPGRQSLGTFWDVMRQLFYRRAHLVTANSHVAISAMAKYVPEKKLRYVRNPISRPAPVTWPRADRQIILSVGRLTEQKGFDVLLRAFANMAQKTPGCRLSIVGQGPLSSRLHQQAKDLEIGDRIDWHKNVSDMAPHYSGATLFTLASRYEGTSNALLEAMSFGLPVVVSNACTHQGDPVSHSENGLCVPINDPVALGSALLKLISDPELQQRFGTAAVKSIEPNDADHVLDQWSEIVELSAPPESVIGAPAA